MKVFSFIILLAASSTSFGQETAKLISYSKGACFGKCPIYSISVNNEGLIIYEGKRFVDKLGTYQRQLTKKEFRKLKRKVRRAKIHKLGVSTELDIMDAPLTTITYKENALETKTGTPEKFKKAEKFLLDLTPISQESQYDWNFIAPIKKQKPAPSRIENELQEIIVQLNTGVEFQTWLKKYYKFGVRFKKKLVPNRPLYLLSFQPRVLALDKILTQMKEDKEVDTVEQNKKVQQRHR